jgi:hypothetical protein
MNPACCHDAGSTRAALDLDRPDAGPDVENVSGFALGAQDLFIG